MINTPIKFTLAMIFIAIMFGIVGHLEWLDYCTPRGEC